MSKFKVGDNVKAISNKYAFTTLECGWTGVVVSISTREHCFSAKTITGHDSSEGHVYRGLCFEDFELIEKEEFTFEEVIARIKEGEVYVPLDKSYATKSIAKRNSGNIIITFHKRVDGCVPTYTKYKLVRQKKEYKLYEVEHKEDGKRYLFRSDLDHTLDDMVVCDTCQGKSYGKMVKVVTKELTEEEYKAYKPIVRIISKGCPF